MDIAVIDAKDVVVVSRRGRRGESAVAEIRLHGVLKARVGFVEIRVQIKSEISDGLSHAMMMGIIRIENADKAGRRGEIDRTPIEMTVKAVILSKRPALVLES